MIKMTEEPDDYEGKWPDPRERAAPARREEMAAFAAELRADPAKALKFFQGAGILNERGELTPEYAAPVQQAEPVEIVPRVWREALRKLTFMARTSGVSAGPDEGLKAACAEAEALLSKPYNYPPAAPQQAEPVAWMFDRRYGSGLSFARPADYENEDGDIISPTPLFKHPPAAEVQRISDERDALKAEVESLKLQRAAAEIVGRETANIVLLQVGEIASLRDALHQISLESQQSGSSKEACGRIARRALEAK